MDMLKKCDELRAELKSKAKISDSFDPLYEYRQWWDMQKIQSEGSGGWPLPFCFDPENILKFAEYWNT